MKIREKHLYRHQRGWLFDESVNAYMWLLQERDNRSCAVDPGRMHDHFFSSFFFAKVNFLEGNVEQCVRDSRPPAL